ncbi:hypothetical protein ACROAE_07230 [Shewanella sp. MF05960]|uniref:hypothetical protein n=1 Tax=Shewanella sp. MF05960 TaxID=3434874 RepID=UPI003D7BA7EB
MVYKNANGDVIIVEAKGGSSPLGKMKIGDEYYQQGTTEYAEAITKKMAGSNKESDYLAAEAINNAVFERNKVQYLHVKTPITRTSGKSVVEAVEISEFDIDPNVFNAIDTRE